MSPPFLPKKDLLKRIYINGVRMMIVKAIMKRKKILSAVLAMMAIFWYVKHHNNANQDEQNAVMVEATTVKESTVPMEAHALGTLTARSIEITPEAPGHVKKVIVQDGVQVKAGELLLQLDDEVLSSKFDSMQAEYNYTRGNYQRMLPLGKRGFVAKDTIEKVEAELKRKKAELQESEVMLNHTKLVAPFSGMVGKCKVSMGEYVNVGQSVLTLTDIQHLRVEYNIPERYLSALRLGQEVKITSAAYPGKVFTGKVSYISPTINAENRSLALYADVPNDKHELASGMLVDVVQSLGSTEHALLIPARSLVPMLDGMQVYKIVKGKAYAINVVVGKRTENDAQIIQGLAAGDMVITDGQMKVKNASAVKTKT